MVALLGAFIWMMSRLSGMIEPTEESDFISDGYSEIYWPESNEQIIHHSTFSLEYDEEHEQAKWVAYVLTGEELKRKFVKRTDWFEEDEAIPTGSANYYDYKGSGYTKGHLIPSADRAWSRSVNAETFLMSNISPQKYHFNGGIWRELEENVRDWARRNDRLYIVTGPVIGNSRKRIGANQVTVPESFFKVILDFDEPELKAIGFLIPNEKTDEPLSGFAMSVNEIEKITELDFFKDLVRDTVLEEKLESRYNMEFWPVDNKRYQRRITVWNQSIN